MLDKPDSLAGRAQNHVCVNYGIDMPRTVLFDADGVLVDSYYAYRGIWKSWSDRHGLDADTVWRATHGRRLADTITDVAPHLDPGTENEALKRLIATQDAKFPLFPGVPDLLKRLPTDAWAVVTSGRAEAVTQRLRAGGSATPSVLVDGSDVSRGKPYPDGFLLAAERLTARPAECLVVEDAPAGIEAGRAAGMSVLAISSTHAVGDLSAADLIAPSFAAAAHAVQAWLTADRDTAVEGTL